MADLQYVSHKLLFSIITVMTVIGIAISGFFTYEMRDLKDDVIEVDRSQEAVQSTQRALVERTVKLESKTDGLNNRISDRHTGTTATAIQKGNDESHSTLKQADEWLHRLINNHTHQHKEIDHGE